MNRRDPYRRWLLIVFTPLLLCLALALAHLIAQTKVDAPSQVKNLPAAEAPDAGNGETPPCPAPVMTRLDAKHLVVGSAWTPSTPCLVWQYGNYVHFQKSVTITLADDWPPDQWWPAHNLVFVWFVPANNAAEVSITMFRADLVTCNNGCTVNNPMSVAPGFPAHVVPIGIWPIDEDGNFEAVGVPFLYRLAFDSSVALDAYVASDGLVHFTVHPGERINVQPNIVPAPASPDVACAFNEIAFDDNDDLLMCIPNRASATDPNAPKYKWQRYLADPTYR